MTTPNVNMPGMVPVGAQEITSGKAKGEGKEDQSFMDVLSIADSAARVKTPEQKAGIDTKNQDQQQARAPKETKKTEGDRPKDVKKDSSDDKSKDIKDTSKADKKPETKDVKDVKEADTKVSEAAKDVKEVVEEKLDISDEELIQVMENLGLTNADLLDPKAMVDIVAEVKDVTPVDMVTDDELTAIVTDLQGSVREITSDL
ncbi:MAG: hypothetical protein IJ075_05280, partial [Lachnospiraceae bacterium]|nr:hypothetical protein [Lachnospiraceae bacterium]